MRFLGGFYYCLPYSFETRSFTEPGTTLVANNFHCPSCLGPKITGADNHLHIFYTGQEF